jgi:hypothetical protein
MNKILFNCPICNKPLTSQSGTQMDPNDGVMVFCESNSCMDSGGHGKNEKEALSVYMQKCGHSQKDMKN